MVYTCAYFARTDATLEAAQLAKLDHVCRKLRLRPAIAWSTRVADGARWRYTRDSLRRRVGRSASRANSRLRARAGARTGRRASVEFIEDDYRNISGQVDAFVSIGMLEHVGREHYGDLGARHRPQPV